MEKGGNEEEEGMEKDKDCASGKVGDDHAQGSDGPKLFPLSSVHGAQGWYGDDAKVGQDEAMRRSLRP